MKFQIACSASTSGLASEWVFSDFPPETWEIINNFIAFSNEAHRTRFAREFSTYKISFHITNTGVVRNNGIVPDEEVLSAFLHKYRPIILNKEPTEFNKVCSLLVRHVGHARFTQVIKEWKIEYSCKRLREVCQMTQGDLLLTGQAFLEDYLNAFEYHRDLGRRQKLAGFTSIFEPEARRGLITLLLMHKFSAVSRLRVLIRSMQRMKAGSK